MKTFPPARKRIDVSVGAHFVINPAAAPACRRDAQPPSWSIYGRVFQTGNSTDQ